MSFCHLHLHDEYSVLDGCGKAEEYAKQAKKLGQKYLALTNHGNIDGLIKFQSACEKESLIPVHGSELYIVEDARVKKKGEKRRHIVVLVKNRAGWRSLCNMLNYANAEGFYHRPRIDPRVLLDNLDGIIVLTACISSFIGVNWGIDLFEQLVDEMSDGDLYIEVMPNIHDLQKTHNKLCIEMADDYDIKLVATSDCHYVYKDDEESQQVLLAINNKSKWDDPDRFKFGFRRLHLLSEKEMRADFAKQGVLPKLRYEMAIKNSMLIAKRCSKFRIKKRKVKLPDSEYGNPDGALRRLAVEGLDKLDLSKRKKVIYRVRVDRELSLIKKKDFSNYFLIVYDLLQYCKKQGIMYGPGRGSVGCCLVAYLIGITSIDSLKWRLPFDRFISEDRIDFPDIDLDFENTKTDLVREYFEDIYGEENVFGISTFLKMRGKAVVRDVSRVFEVPLYEVNKMADGVDDSLKEGAVEDAVENNPVCQDFEEEYPEVIKHARRLEGQIRGAGQHPAAIVIASGRKDDAVLTMRSKGLVCNWDMQDAEYMGLMKFDILKLNNISILSEAKKMIEENYGVEINYSEIPLDDKKVFETINSGGVTGLFQIAGWATASVLREVLVDDFMVISDVIALSRPGPKDSGMTDAYIERRVNGDWKRRNRLFEKEVKDTYGVVVYQEQVMGILRSVAGFSYSDADRIRKIIGKKRDKKEFAPFKRRFIRGALKKGAFNREEAEDFWSGLEKHARYSFNKAHSVEYAMISYWDAWLKTYYPEEFIAASLTYGSEKHKDELVAEARDKGLTLVAPKIGISDGMKWVVKDKKIYIPFIEVDGIGEASLGEIDKIYRNMENSCSMRSFFDCRKKFVPRRKTKVEKLLYDIGAYGDETPDTAADYFKFDVASVTGESVLIEKRSFKINRALAKCTLCGLRKEARRPVLPSRGIINVVITGEAPGPDEDAEGVGFVGRAGQLLWGKDGLGAYGLKRKYFHITNICKCYPSKSKTPNSEQIQTCFENWLLKEILDIDAKIILAFGNTSLKAFTSKKSGITKCTGKVEWIEKIKAHVVWCVHPAWVLRNKEENMSLFRKGLDAFNQLLMKKNFSEFF